MLQWFDSNPNRFPFVVAVVIAGVGFILIRPFLRLQWIDRKASDWRWGISIALLLCAGRWPSWFVTRLFNEDEGQLIGGAITLRQDPVFWRSVDGCTAGPLDFYALLPIGWLRGADDIISARITAAILIGAALLFVHQSLAITFGRQLARVSTIAPTFLESLTLHKDLLHYSTELVPLALLAVAFWLGVRRIIIEADSKWNLVGGLTLGLVPFAKLQAGPSAALLGVLWVAVELFHAQTRHSRLRNIALLCGGAVLPLMLVISVLVATGEIRNAFIPYILANLEYAKQSDSTLGFTIADLWHRGSNLSALLTAWLVGCGVWMLLAGLFARVPEKKERLIMVAAVGFLITSLFCVLLPHRAYLHYMQLLIVPVTLAAGIITGLALNHPSMNSAPRRLTIYLGTLIFSLSSVAYERQKASNLAVGQLEKFQENPRTAIANEILKHARPGESVGVWGWMTACYAQTGLRQGTRSAISLMEIDSVKYRTYFLERYLADFTHSSPPVFVDSVGTDGFVFKDRQHSHERSFPALGDYVAKHYTQVAEIQSARIYVRNSRLAMPVSNTQSLSHP